MAVLCVLAAAACGGDAAGPDEPNEPEVPAKELRLSVESAAPFEAIQVAVDATVVAEQEYPATLGSDSVSAVGLNDSTLVVFISEVPAGTHQLSIRLGNEPYGASLRVEAAAAIAPDALWQQVFARLEARVAELESRLADQTTPPSDPELLQNVLSFTQTSLDDLRTNHATMTPTERAHSAAFIAANAQAIGLDALSVDARLSSAGFDFCGFGDWNFGKCYDAATTGVAALFNGFQQCGVMTGMRWALYGTGAGAVVFRNARGAAIGAAAGYALAMGYCVYELNSKAVEQVFDTTIPQITEVSGHESTAYQSPSIASAPPAYTVGHARSLQALVELRSISLADSHVGVVAGIAATLAKMKQLWQPVADDLPFTVNMPELPAQPQSRVTTTIPVEYLQVGSPSVSGTTASATGTGTELSVTFENADIGRDHEMSFDVTFLPSGIAAQTLKVSAMLQPESYAVARVVMPDTMTIDFGDAPTLLAEARDSNDVALPNATMRWFSGDTDIVRIDSISGAVTTVDTGTVAIFARASGTRGDTATAQLGLRVAPSTIVGTYILDAVDGQPLPVVRNEDDDSRSEYVSGTMELNADNTYAWFVMVQVLRKETGETEHQPYETAGSYTVSGNTIRFDQTHEDGSPDQETYSGSIAGSAISVTIEGTMRFVKQ